MSLKFWFKTFIYRWMPGGYGYVRRLRHERDQDYQFVRDAHAVRKKHNSRSGWQENQGQSLVYRDYEDYEEYLTHQKQKLDEMLKINGGFSNKTICRYRRRFHRRFRHLKHLLPSNAKILCCGARQGTEVEVLRDLGYRQAYGIDLNPGPENPYVIPGDFMKLDVEDGSLDLIYSNCLDHAFDLPAMALEHARAIADDGYALYDVSTVEEAAGPFESVSWNSTDHLLSIFKDNYSRVVQIEKDGRWMWLLFQGPRKDRDNPPVES